MRKTVSFLTYNICFKRFQYHKRVLALNEILGELCPDIVCLQEVTNQSLSEFLKSAWSKEYYVSTYHIDRRYGEVIFSKYPYVLNESFPLSQTYMNRHINVMDLSIPINSDGLPLGHRMTVVAVHLESLPDNKRLRKNQLYSIFELMENESNVFILADTNFTDEPGDTLTDAEMPEYWADTWTVLVSDAAESESDDSDKYAGYTYDSERNVNVEGKCRYRYDRILYKSVEWEPIKVSLVGTDPIRGTKDVYPSEHFGLLAEFAFGPEDIEEETEEVIEEEEDMESESASESDDEVDTLFSNDVTFKE